MFIFSALYWGLFIKFHELRNNLFVDNAYAGGTFIGTNEYETFVPNAFDDYCHKFEQHPDTHTNFSQIKFEFYQIIKYKAHSNSKKI